MCLWFVLVDNNYVRNTSRKLTGLRNNKKNNWRPSIAVVAGLPFYTPLKDTTSGNECLSATSNYNRSYFIYEIDQTNYDDN